jgi:hypothetical protein
MLKHVAVLKDDVQLNNFVFQQRQECKSIIF